MNITFRHAKLKDVPKIVELCNLCFNENTSIEYASAVFKSTLNDKKHIYIVGLRGDEIVAHLKITLIPTMYESMQTYSIINHFCVKPKYRRIHIGTEMLKYTESILKTYNVKCIELWSKNFRKEAHACYQNYGFEVMDAKFFVKNIE